MEILQLTYFCDAAQTENYSRTAEKYFVPASSVSQSIKRLEAELGCELFDHRKNKISLNENGRMFYARASEALKLLDEAKAELTDDKDPHGELKIVCRCNRSALTNAIETFSKKYPRVRLSLSHSLDGCPDPDLLISDECYLPFSEKHLLWNEEILLALRSDHPLAVSSKLSVEELKGQRFVTMTEGGSLNAITKRLCAEAGFTPDIAIQTDDPSLLRRYVELGLGIAFIPSMTWRDLMGSSITLVSLNNVRRRIYAFITQKKTQKTSVNSFIELLTEADEH